MKKMMPLIMVLSLVMAVVPVPVMGEFSLEGLLDKAKEAGISQETIEQAANSDDAKTALKDGTAQQFLTDAEDAAKSDGSGEGMSWGEWVQSNLGKVASSAPPPEEAARAVIGDLLSPSGPPSESPSLSPSVTASASPPSLSPSPTPSASPPSLSPSPTPSASPPLLSPLLSPLPTPSASPPAPSPLPTS